MQRMSGGTRSRGGSTRREFVARGGGGLLGVALASQLEWVERALAAGWKDSALPSTPSSIAFNAFHAPVGGYASFTLGRGGNSGGVAVEGLTPANQDVFVGAQRADGSIAALPFFSAQSGDPTSIAGGSVTRDYRVGTDNWQAQDLDLRVYSPVHPVPEPGVASDAELREGLLPAVLATVTIDNRSGAMPRRAFFGIRLPASGNGPPPTTTTGYFVPSTATPTVTASGSGTPGFVYDDGNGRKVGIYCADPEASAAAGLDLRAAITGAPGGSASGNSSVGMLRLDVPPGRKVSFRIAIGFWHPGNVATESDPTGPAASYWYTRLFSSLDEVVAYALRNYDRLAGLWEEENGLLDEARLSRDQRFQLIQAIRSYFGNTALLAVGDRPLWAVMEGDYGIINTFDLTVDDQFFELRNNPWTVRNELDWYLERWSYTDNTNAIVADNSAPTVIQQPGATIHNPVPEPGGISFTHDMGRWPTFSSPGTSNYESPGLSGVGSFMTSEELTNWTLIALTYIVQTGDEVWANAHVQTLEACLTSLVNRDDSDPGARDGIMSLETDKEGPNGSEITTYDSLDPSLGQARHSAYLTGKQWAAYVCLAKFFDAHHRSGAAATARQQAQRAAGSIVAAAKQTGYIPALLPADGEAASPSRVIPAIEGLVFPLYAGAPEALNPRGEYAALMNTMTRHIQTVLTKGTCLFADGGWKLSSTSDNSWLSKIYLCQFISRRILGMPWDAAGRIADAAHVKWLTGTQIPAGSYGPTYGADYWCFTDQFISGASAGSQYYPRGVTSVLWLEEHHATARFKPVPTVSSNPRRRRRRAHHRRARHRLRHRRHRHKRS